jgi:hypothetical protein
MLPRSFLDPKSGLGRRGSIGAKSPPSVEHVCTGWIPNSHPQVHSPNPSHPQHVKGRPDQRRIEATTLIGWMDGEVLDPVLRSTLSDEYVGDDGSPPDQDVGSVTIELLPSIREEIPDVATGPDPYVTAGAERRIDMPGIGR